MAGTRQPIDLVIINGKKHLTKEEIEFRKNSEVKAPCDMISPPSYLNAKQKKKFIQISEQLEAIGIMSNLDCDCLARYIIAEALYIEISKRMNIKAIQEDIFEFEKMANLQDKYFKQCRSIANDLGLSITSRCRLVVPQAKDEKPANKFDQFRSGTG